MAYSDAQREATERYNRKTYERIELKVKKGQKDYIQKAATSTTTTSILTKRRLRMRQTPARPDRQDLSEALSEISKTSSSSSAYETY